MPDGIIVRNAEVAEIDRLAQLWYEAWQDAHAKLVPAELARLRTVQSLRRRLAEAYSNIRVVGSTDDPLGFCIVKGDELYQLFVAARARGTGVAAALIHDAEARLAGAGVETAWLACAIGNERAARFYEKNGWHRAGTLINLAETSAGIFRLEVWRYEKSMRRDGHLRVDAAGGESR